MNTAELLGVYLRLPALLLTYLNFWTAAEVKMSWWHMIYWLSYFLNLRSDVVVNWNVPRLFFTEDIGDIERLQVGYGSK